MNEVAVLLLGPSEVSGLLEEFPALAGNSSLIFMTADAYQRGRESGLPPCSLPDWVLDFVSFDLEIYQQLEMELIQLETDSCDTRRSIFGFTNSDVDWNFQSNYFMALSAVGAKKAASAAGQYFKRFQKVYIPSVGHAGEFYFDSNWQPNILCHELRQLGVNSELVILEATRHSKTYHPSLYEYLPDIASESAAERWIRRPPTTLVATSAIFNQHDRIKLTTVLRDHTPGATPAIYPIPLWPAIQPTTDFDIKISIREVLNFLSTDDRRACMMFYEWLTSATSQFYKSLIERKELERDPLFIHQVNRLHKRHFFQVITYLAWRKLFRSKPAQGLIISAQDSSINGPLASAAQENHVPVITVPHSRVVNWRTHTSCLVATEWWQPRPSTDLWGRENQCVYFDPSKFYARDKSKETPTWIILYNGTQENLLCSTSWRFIKNIVDITSQAATLAGKRLVHRLKPGDQTPLIAYSEILALDVEKLKMWRDAPLEMLISSAELIIGVDEPSSALWDAVIAGTAVTLVSARPMTRESLLDDKIISALDFDGYKLFLSNLRSDPTALAEFNKTQQDRMNSAKNLRLTRQSDVRN